MDADTKIDLVLVELKKICEQIDDKFEHVNERFEQIDNRLDNMDKRINDLSTEMGALNRTLFKLDLDTQENFRILSDAIKAHADKEILFEKQLYRLTDQLDNTTFRVSILEDTLVHS